MSNLKEMYVSENHLCESADNALDDGAACIVYPKYEVDVRIKSLEQQLEIACKELKEVMNCYTHAITEIEKLNLKLHGYLHGWDCEGGCACKPDDWITLEALKYHFLGSEIGTQEALDKISKLKAQGGADENVIPW